MKSLIKRLISRFVSGFTGMLVIGIGLETLDKSGSVKKRLQETWEKERDAVAFVAILGGVANMSAELAVCLGRRLYRTVRSGS